MDLQLIRDKNIPFYKQIYDYFADKILYGYYKEGDKLPTYNAVCKELSVSSITVKTAYQMLKADGLIKMSNGLGSFVAEIDKSAIYHSITQNISAILDNARKNGVDDKMISQCVEFIVDRYC